MAEHPDYATAIAAYYGGFDFEAAIVRAALKDGRATELELDDIGPADQLHFGGRTATEALAQLADLRPGQRVLDVGSGLGGPARTLADAFGCDVTGLDLSPEFCHTASSITERLGLGDRVRFEQGSALAIPFPDRTFDVVWMQYAGMNIPSKEQLYAEVQRVLRPGGKYVLSELMGGSVQPMHFPVPWAPDESLSFVRPAQEIRGIARAAGLREDIWNEQTQRRPAPSTAEPATADNVFQLKWGSDAPRVMQTLSRNLVEGRIIAVQAVFSKP